MNTYDKNIEDANTAILKLHELYKELERIDATFDRNPFTFRRPSDSLQDLYWDIKKALVTIKPLVAMKDLVFKNRTTKI